MDNGRMPGSAVQFGDGFEIDRTAFELRRAGRPQKLERIPLEILFLLLDRRGQLVTREEIIEAVWGKGVFLDSDNSINAAISKIRQVLKDDSENPTSVQTVRGKGYRFIAAVTEIGVPELPPVAVTQPESRAESPKVDLPLPVKPSAGIRWPLIIGAVVLLGGAAVAIVLTTSHRKPILTETDTVVLADFTNTTGDPVFDETLRQGMAVELDQSPYLSLVAEPRIQQTLRLMGQSADARLTPETAFEVCERTASAAVISGSISSLGSQYVLALRAKDCRSGRLFDEQQIQVARKEDVLHALTGMASQFRRKAGESLKTVQEHAKPLEEATTTSLEALKAYSTGVKVQNTSGSLSAIPFLKRAIELDPKFAQAYAYLSRMYGDVGDYELSSEIAAKAYELRDQASDPERFFITAHYYIAVTGNMEKAEKTCSAWAQTYPRDKAPHGFRAGLIYPVLGNFEATVGESKEVIRLDPNFPIGYSILTSAYTWLDRLDEAQTALQMASQRGLEIPDFPIQRYDLAFLRGDHAEMERQLVVAEKLPGDTDWIYSRRASALGYSGHLQEALKVSQHAVQLAQEADQYERAAQFQIATAVRNAFFGEAGAAQRSAIGALAISSGRDVQYGAALVFVLTGDNSRAAAMASNLEKSFPEDTAVRFSYLPTIRALLALKQGEPYQAIKLLQAAIPYKLGVPPSSYLGIFGALYPVYVRGEALRAAHRGREASQEFQKILDHRGIVLSDPIGALAHLQLGRAYALAGNKDKARSAYRDFLTLCKDADPNIPVLSQAKAEYAKLQ
jgi:eukaryotic-like serine/threonine-protein kinase